MTRRIGFGGGLSWAAWVIALLVSCCCVGGAQTEAAGGKLPLELAWRVEVLFRAKVALPPMAVVQVGARSPSEIAGYDRLTVRYTADGVSSAPMAFLLSRDEKTLVPFQTFALGGDPRREVADAGRPARGGAESAPVEIVLFDDLECPFCAQFNATMFPGVLDRYKDRVRVVSMDLPSPAHPWAMRAAVDTGCLAKESVPAYWEAVDAIHLHASELGGKDRSLKVADERLDAMVREGARERGVDSYRLQACVAKQDAEAVEAMRRQAEALGIERTPTFFVNGAKVEGAVSKEFLFGMIDRALAAQGSSVPGAGQ